MLASSAASSASSTSSTGAPMTSATRAGSMSRPISAAVAMMSNWLSLSERRWLRTTAVMVGGQPVVGQPGDLAHEERVAVGAGRDALDDGRPRLVAGDGAEQLAHLGPVQAPEPDGRHRRAGQLGQRGAEPVVAVDMDLAARHRQQQARVRQQRREVLDQQEGRLVGPLEVLDDDHRGLALGPAQQEAADGVEQAEAGAVVVGQQGLGPAGAAEHRHQAGQQTGVARFAGVAGVVEVGGGLVGRAAQHLQPRPERGRPARLRRPAPQHRNAPAGAVAGGLLQQAALADAGLAGHQRDPTLAHAGPVDGRAHARQVEVAAHERALAGRCHRGQGRHVDGQGHHRRRAGGQAGGRGRRPAAVGTARATLAAGGHVHHHARAGPGAQRGGGEQVVVAVDDAALQVEDLAAGIDAQLGPQQAPHLAGRAERVRPPPGPVAGHHQLSPVALVQGLVHHQPLEQRQDLAVAAEGEQGVGAALLGHAVEPAPVVGGLLDPAGPGEVGQRVAPPQLQRVVDGRHPIAQVRLVDARHDQLLELDRVDVVGHQQLVAPGP